MVDNLGRSLSPTLTKATQMLDLEEGGTKTLLLTSVVLEMSRTLDALRAELRDVSDELAKFRREYDRCQKKAMRS